MSSCSPEIRPRIHTAHQTPHPCETPNPHPQPHPCSMSMHTSIVTPMPHVHTLTWPLAAPGCALTAASGADEGTRWPTPPDLVLPPSQQGPCTLMAHHTHLPARPLWVCADPQAEGQRSDHQTQSRTDRLGTQLAEPALPETWLFWGQDLG